MWWNVSSWGRRAILKSNSAPEGTFSCSILPRHVCAVNAYEAFVPRMSFEPCLEGKPAWRSSILIPWSMVPVHMQGVNAYVISRNHYLCYHPLPGPKPDFHQPERFPSVRLEGRA